MDKLNQVIERWAQTNEQCSSDIDVIISNVKILPDLNCYQYNTLFSNFQLVKQMFDKIPDICKYISFCMISDHPDNLMNVISLMTSINEIDNWGNNILEACIGNIDMDEIKIILDKGFDVSTAPYLLYAKDSPLSILESIPDSEVLPNESEVLPNESDVIFHQQDTVLRFDHKLGKVDKVKEIVVDTIFSSSERFTETLNISKLLKAGINNVVSCGNQGIFSIEKSKDDKYYLCLKINKFDGHISSSDAHDWKNILHQCTQFLDNMRSKAKMVHGDIKSANILKRKIGDFMEYVPADYETAMSVNAICNQMTIDYKLWCGSYYQYVNDNRDDYNCLLFSIATLFMKEDISEIIHQTKQLCENIVGITYDKVYDNLKFAIIETYRDKIVINHPNVPNELKQLLIENRKLNTDLNLRINSLNELSPRNTLHLFTTQLCGKYNEPFRHEIKLANDHWHKYNYPSGYFGSDFLVKYPTFVDYLNSDPAISPLFISSVIDRYAKSEIYSKLMILYNTFVETTKNISFTSEI